MTSVIKRENVRVPNPGNHGESWNVYKVVVLSPEIAVPLETHGKAFNKIETISISGNETLFACTRTATCNHTEFPDCTVCNLVIK